MRKKVLISLLILIVATTALTACNKRNKPTPSATYGDIYVQHGGFSKKTSVDSARTITLDKGVIPYYTGKNDKREYTDAYDKENGVLKVRKDTLGEDGKTVVSSTFGFISLKTKKLIGQDVKFNSDFFVENGFIGVNFSGTYELYKSDGTLLHQVSATSKNVSEMFMTLSENYYAVSNGNDDWQIYSAKNLLVPVAGGKKFNTKYVDQSDNKEYSVSYIAVDDYIVETRMVKASWTNPNGSILDIIVYDALSGKELTSFFRGLTPKTGTIRASFYLGNGKFYCYEQNNSTKDDGYQYKVLTNPEKENVDERYSYHKISVWTYDVRTSTKTLIVPDRIFSTIINKYYKKDVGRDISNYINEGYSWVSVGISRDKDRVATQNQQYVIDSDLNIYVSLNDKSGSATNYDKGSSDYRYVKLTFIDGYGFDEESSGDLIIYDTKGNTVFRKEGDYSKMFYNNGIVTALKNVKGTKYAVAYKLDGTVVFDETRGYADLVGGNFNNDRIAFYGKYTIVKKGTGYFLVDNNGRDIGNPSLKDMFFRTDSYGAQTPFFFNGVYVTKDTTNKLGLKNYDGDIIFENKFESVIIDSRKYGEVIFYAKENDTWKVYFL